MLKKSASVVLASLRDSTYCCVRLASSLASALLGGLFEHPVGAVWIGLALWGMIWSSTVSAAEQRVPLRVAIHVHSTASTGTLSLEALAVRAEQQGLDAIVLSGNVSLEYEYGLQPFPGLLKKTVSFPSVLSYGVERYLDEIKAAQARHPQLVIVPGVEVAPYYYWTGSLWRGDLTMHDAQRNLLVLGLTKAKDYRALPCARIDDRGAAGSGSTPA